MTVHGRVVIAVLWVLSLVVVAQLAGRAESQPTIGHEVRFLRGAGSGAGHRGVLIANFSGQWLPVTLEEMPDANPVLPHRLPPQQP